MNIKGNSLLILVAMIIMAAVGAASADVTGYVFQDLNRNGLMDAGEGGVANVSVSNGTEVVKTNLNGQYTLPDYNDMVVFVTKPSGYALPVDVNNTPQFYYVHKPAGSPDNIVKFRGLEPTGQLPASVDFPLYRISEPMQFKAIINGDTQPRNNKELDYVRDSLIADVVSNHPDAILNLTMGDVMYDDLALFPRAIAIQGQMGMPIHWVPGNHDEDYDAVDNKDSWDTWKSHLGPAYYSFNVGKVHFVVLDSVDYKGNKSYSGRMDEQQLTWLANDLANTPSDMLIFLNMHIPLYSLSNRTDVYQVIGNRRAVGVSAHTHRQDHFLAGDVISGQTEPISVDEIVLGAACGSWWAQDLDNYGIPLSPCRCGAPRGYHVFEFDGSDFIFTFKPSQQAADKQLHLDFLTQQFRDWFAGNRTTDPNQYVNRFALTDRHVLTTSDLIDPNAMLVVNVYAGSNASTVICEWDNGLPVLATKERNVMDPFALRNQTYLTDHITVEGGELPKRSGNWTTENQSTHIWTCAIPYDLAIGTHKVLVTTIDIYGREWSESLVFEVTE